MKTLLQAILNGEKVVYLTLDYYKRDKVADFGKFCHIFPGCTVVNKPAVIT